MSINLQLLSYVKLMTMTTIAWQVPKWESKTTEEEKEEEEDEWMIKPHTFSCNLVGEQTSGGEYTTQPNWSEKQYVCPCSAQYTWMVAADGHKAERERERERVRPTILKCMHVWVFSFCFVSFRFIILCLTFPLVLTRAAFTMTRFGSCIISLIQN